MKFFDELKKGIVLRSIVMAAVGIMLLLYPEMAQNTIAYIIAAVFVINGIIHIVGYFRNTSKTEDGLNSYSSGLVVGILCIVFAVLISKVLIRIIPIVLGLIVLFSGLVKLQQAVEIIRMKRDGWMGIMIMSVITIIAGLLAVFNPFKTGSLLLRIIGAGLLFGGITDLISTGYMSKKFRHLEDDDLGRF